MKIYRTENLGEECNICGNSDSVPLKIARAMTGKVLDNETLHYHLKGHEFYLFIRGSARMRISDGYVEVKAGDMVHVEPYEPHRIEEIFGLSDYLVINTNPDPKDKVVLEE